MPYPRQLTDDVEKEIANTYRLGLPIRELRRKYHLGDKLIRNAIRRQGVIFRPLGTKGVSINLPTNTRDLGYIAGLIDADGYISWNKRYPHIGISNTSVKLMNYLATLGGSVSWRTRTKLWKSGNRSATKPIAEWTIQTTLNVILLLRAIIPAMKIKKQKAQDMLTELEKRVDFGF